MTRKPALLLLLLLHLLSQSSNATHLQADDNQRPQQSPQVLPRFQEDRAEASAGSLQSSSITSLEDFIAQTEQAVTSSSATSSNPINNNKVTSVKSSESTTTALIQLERESDALAPNASAKSAPHRAVIEPTSNGYSNYNVDRNPGVSVPGASSTQATTVAHHQAGPTPTNATSKPIQQHWQIKSLLNVTHDYPLTYSQVIFGYIWPLMAGITLFTNLMIVFVLRQRDMRTPTNVVLTAIAIADIIPILVPVPWFIYLFAFGNERQVLYPPVVCYVYQHSTRSVSEFFYFLSTWLNVLLALQDYLTACWPNLAKKYCRIKVVVIEIVALTLLALSLNLPQALKVVFRPVKFYYNGQITWGCRALQAKWFKEIVGEYAALYDDIFTAIIVLFVDGGPAIALIVLTALLIRQLHRQRLKGHLLMEQARTASKRRRERHRQQEIEASARVMIFVLLAFLAVKIPFATTYTLMIIQSRFDIHFVENLVDFQKAITITDLIFVLSYPLNFTIFCCCSKKFRHKCTQLLGECNQGTQSTKKRLMATWASYSFDSDGGSLSYKTGRGKQSIVSIASSQIPLEAKHSLEVDLNRKPADIIVNSRQGSVFAHATDPNHRDRVECSHQIHPTPQIDLSPQYMSKLEDGNLCLECIVQYEQLKARSSMGSSPGETMRRNSSMESTSWPLSPPPEPPLAKSFQNAFRDLPHIITTRCESIQEQSPVPAEDSESVEPTSESSAVANIKADLVSAKNELYANCLTRETCSDNEGLKQTHIFNRAKSLVKQQSKFRGETNGARVFSDPGNSYGATGSKRLSRQRSRKSQDTSRDEDGDDEGAGGAGSSRESSEIDTRRRALSLSNSKLSSLPNATGQLADVLLSTLFLAPGDANTSRASSESRDPSKDKQKKSKLKLLKK